MIPWKTSWTITECQPAIDEECNPTASQTCVVMVRPLGLITSALIGYE